jgi:hypothetical protein
MAGPHLLVTTIIRCRNREQVTPDLAHANGATGNEVRWLRSPNSASDLAVLDRFGHVRSGQMWAGPIRSPVMNWSKGWSLMARCGLVSAVRYRACLRSGLRRYSTPCAGARLPA